MDKQLTVAVLKKLPFAFSLHLNRGKQHDSVVANDEFKLAVSTTTQMRDYKIVQKILYETGGRLPKERVVDLLAKDRDAQIEKFCADYNAAV